MVQSGTSVLSSEMVKLLEAHKTCHQHLLSTLDPEKTIKLRGEIVLLQEKMRVQTRIEQAAKTEGIHPNCGENFDHKSTTFN